MRLLRYSPSCVHRVQEEKPVCPLIPNTKDLAGASQHKT